MMDLLKYISVLAVLFFGGGDTGGHGGSHHDHVKLHVLEFIHHDHHTKVITIHHHHHKPKEKHHHHHHHHHHQPPVPYGHHYHKQHKKSHTKLHTTTTSHGKGHNSHHGGYHGKHGHHAQKHHDPPSFSYEPNPVTFDEDFKSFAPSAPPSGPRTPQVYGVQHTVKQVKVFDSLPGAIASNAGSHGYEVTEEGEHSGDDAFTAVDALPHSYPATFNFVRNVGGGPTQNDVLADFPVHSSLQASHDPFVAAPSPTSYGNVETFSTAQDDPFSSLAPYNGNSPSVSSFQEDVPATGFDEANVYSADVTGTSSLSNDDGLNDDTPVSFAREAGIQEIVNTGDVQTIEY